MTKDQDSWLVAKSDSDGTWLDNAGNQVEVDITPTIWNLLKRVTLIEENCCANVNAAIVCMKETRVELSQQVAQAVSNVQNQQQTHSETVARLLMTHHHEHLDQAVKLKDAEAAISGIRKAIAEITEGVRMLQEDRAERLETSVSEAKFEELMKDVTSLREKVHYSFVKTELEHDVVETIEKMELLRATVGSCLLRNEEMQQTIAGVTKDIAILRRDLANNAADSIPEIVDLSEHPRPEWEAGEVPQCTCKRKRR